MNYSKGGIMKFKSLMIIKAIVCLGFGPLLLFLPANNY